MDARLHMSTPKASTMQVRELCETYQTPPLVTSSWMLGRIGEALDQTAGVIKARQLGLLKYKPMICLTGRDPIANRAFFTISAGRF